MTKLLGDLEKSGLSDGPEVPAGMLAPPKTYYIIIIFLFLILAVCMAPGGHAHETKGLQPCWLLWPPTKENTIEEQNTYICTRTHTSTHTKEK